ncbi:aminodeoxychorismate/anthranilate synthase component II, partial [Campylobacter jejuni]|nr:aminodeoxychorismate/anthranilate synthase component II [Campylobacter jejuni]EAL9062982.1 aminodeoxychorismate/anthranilate synthase component II [Campylobacter jejuni]EJY1786931.1 aminodeoxychorismate/anthranilate synthase component II [Campylobacter jejuni]
ILAHNSENIIMAIKHKKYPIYGLQFHPEAVLTQKGKKLLKNFMKL